MRAASVYPYWQNMGEFEEVMTGVSDASVFIDAVRAAGYDVTKLSGTIIVPINQVGGADRQARRGRSAGLDSLARRPIARCAGPCTVRCARKCR